MIRSCLSAANPSTDSVVDMLQQHLLTDRCVCVQHKSLSRLNVPSPFFWNCFLVDMNVGDEILG